MASKPFLSVGNQALALSPSLITFPGFPTENSLTVMLKFTH